MKAEILQLSGASLVSVEDAFRRSLDIASQQGALSYELRTATGLAHFLSEHDRGEEVRVPFAPIVESFTEGFGTVDVEAAHQFLGELA